MNEGDEIITALANISRCKQFKYWAGVKNPVPVESGLHLLTAILKNLLSVLEELKTHSDIKDLNWEDILIVLNFCSSYLVEFVPIEATIEWRKKFAVAEVVEEVLILFSRCTAKLCDDLFPHETWDLDRDAIEEYVILLSSLQRSLRYIGSTTWFDDDGENMSSNRIYTYLQNIGAYVTILMMKYFNRYPEAPTLDGFPSEFNGEHQKHWIKIAEGKYCQQLHHMTFKENFAFVKKIIENPPDSKLPNCANTTCKRPIKGPNYAVLDGCDHILCIVCGEKFAWTG